MGRTSEEGVLYFRHKEDIYFLYNTETGSGAHPTSYTIGNGGCSAGGGGGLKRRRRETDRLPSSSA
jgi:hypothetical protein